MEGKKILLNSAQYQTLYTFKREGEEKDEGDVYEDTSWLGNVKGGILL